ncbi:hypothetical protein B0H34DRAFT_799827 [Crassisporium funariophilum]|nr:hypothetical protein B0H34DRAFT_799827 [Crassisporium funariophilum]
MARTNDQSQCQSSATQRYKEQKRQLHNIEALAILLLSDANDDDEEITALLVAQYAMEEARQLKIHGGGRYGRRGLYNQRKSKDFFFNILYEASEKSFKAWMQMDRRSFWYLHDLISKDTIFISTGARPQ